MAVKVGDLVSCSACGGAGYIRGWFTQPPSVCGACDGTGEVKLQPATGRPLWDPKDMCSW